MAWKFFKDTTKTARLPANAISSILAGTGIFNFSCWFYANSLDAGTNCNRFMSIAMANGFTGFAAGQNSDGTVYVGARSVTTDSFQKATTTKTYPINTWHHVFAIVSIGGDFIDLFVDGQFESRTSVTFTNSVYTNGIPSTNFDFFGADVTTGTPSSTTFQWNGFIQGITFWAVANVYTQIIGFNNRIATDLFYKKINPPFIFKGRPAAYPVYPMIYLTAAGRQSGSSSEGSLTASGVTSEAMGVHGLGNGIPMRYRPMMRAVLNSVASSSTFLAKINWF